jgi:tripartite-type tricarboxylate transporter receptor subunit TctC
MKTVSGEHAQRYSPIAKIGVVALAFGVGIAAGSAWAQPFPVKPVRLVVASAPGGTDDFIGRTTAQQLTKVFGQQFIVDNRVGAGGLIGQEHVAKSLPDGYTLLVGGGLMTAAQFVRSNLPFNVMRDFVPVSLLATIQGCLLVNPALPARTTREFIALAKARPGQLNFGSGGIGQSAYFSATYFSAEAKIKTVHVPYKSFAAAITDVVSGQIHYVFALIPSAVRPANSGKLRALGVTGMNRSPALPDVPTIAEAALPSFEFSTWLSIMAPAGTSSTVIDTLNSAIVRVVALPEVHERLTMGGIEPASSTPEELVKRMIQGAEKYGRIAKQTGLKPE